MEVWLQLESAGVPGDKSRVGVLWGSGGCPALWRDPLVIPHDVSTDVLPAPPQEHSDSPKEPTSSNSFLHCNNPANDRNRSPPGTRRSNWASPAALSSAGSPPHAHTSLHPGPRPATSLADEAGEKTPQTVPLLLPGFKNNWDDSYFGQFVFKYAMLQPHVSKRKLRCGRLNNALHLLNEKPLEIFSTQSCCFCSQPGTFSETQRSLRASASPHVTPCNSPI